MIKLLSYQTEERKVVLNFEKEQQVSIHQFGNTLFCVTTDGITKASVKEIKDKLHKNGFDTDLSEFIGREFEQYFEKL